MMDGRSWKKFRKNKNKNGEKILKDGKKVENLANSVPAGSQGGGTPSKRQKLDEKN
jgi:hypothetical protein